MGQVDSAGPTNLAHRWSHKCHQIELQNRAEASPIAVSRVILKLHLQATPYLPCTEEEAQVSGAEALHWIRVGRGAAGEQHQTFRIHVALSTSPSSTIFPRRLIPSTPRSLAPSPPHLQSSPRLSLPLRFRPAVGAERRRPRANVLIAVCARSSSTLPTTDDSFALRTARSSTAPPHPLYTTSTNTSCSISSCSVTSSQSWSRSRERWRKSKTH